MYHFASDYEKEECAMNYKASCDQQVKRMQEQAQACLLAIETSCDETAAAVVSNGRVVHSSVIASQIKTHALYGGVVPEIASRQHIEAIATVVKGALWEAGKSLTDIDAIAVTYGPGLVGALLVGVNYAKGLAYAGKLPLVPVNHIEGHICANYIAYPDLTPPFVCLVASGGHSHIVAVEDYGSYQLLGQTQDDAAGEAFDKAARVLKLPYPGGPILDELAEHGDPMAMPLPRARLEGRYDFSFSGVKTALINRVHRLQQTGVHLPDADIAASFRKAIVDALVDKTILAARETNAKAICVAGGVAANRLLRRELSQSAAQHRIPCFIPPVSLCTDNAAMIGSAGFYRLMRGEMADVSLNALPNASLCT